MTTYIEDIVGDTFLPDPISPVAGDLLDGTLNAPESGPDSIDGINLQLIEGYTYTFSMLAPLATELYYIPGEAAEPVFAVPVGDGPGNQLTFTAAASGVYTLFVESGDYVDYIIDVTAADAPIDPDAPTEGNDTIFGGGGADSAFLLGGDDRYLASGGSDTVDGGEGRDLIFGQNGADSLFGGAGDDKMFGGNGVDTLDGGTGRDNLYGNGGADSIDGGDGNDKLLGGGGNDTLNGGNNNDRLFGGGNDDVMSGGQGNDRLQGQNGNDLMSGGTGKDTMIGGNGDDTIAGGAGDDFMRGGSGADVFVFENGMNRDIISDFEDGVDVLDFSAMGIVDISQLTLTTVGNHVMINASPSERVLVRNTDIADLTNADFIFDDIFVVG